MKWTLISTKIVALASAVGLITYGGAFALDRLADTQTQSSPKTSNAAVRQAYGRLALSFEPNRGQTDKQVKFLARGPGHTLFLTPGEAVLSMTKAPSAKSASSGPATREQSVVRMQMVGANSNPSMSAQKSLPGKVNYLLGGNRSGWRTGIPTYGRVSYKAVYPGIDMAFYGKQGQMEYDFIVAPGADPKAIKLSFEGSQGLSLNPHGDLVIQTDGAELIQHKPVLYQVIGGKKQAVTGKFTLNPDNQVGFQIGSYDKGRTLIIDPVLSYSTYLGGTGTDVGFGLAVNSAGEAFVTGQNGSTNFPTLGSVSCSGSFPTSSFQCNQPADDAFVTKLNAAGSALVWSTYLGGSKADTGWRIAIDGSGNPYVIGTTNSADDPGTTAVEAGFPTTANAYDSTCGTDGFCNAPLPTAASCPPASFPSGCPTIGTSDTFLAKLNSTGSALMYSTYLGGSDQEHDGLPTAVPGHMGVAVSGSKAYLASNTGSTDFPVTSGAFQSSCASCAGGGLDSYLSVIDTAASGAGSLVYSTYLGGSGDDQAKSVAVDEAGNAYVSGTTASLGANSFPTTAGALQSSYQGGVSDAFVAKINPNLLGAASLVYSTFLGGGGKDEGWGIAVKGGGLAGNASAYLTGFTNSGDDPSTPAADGPAPYFPTSSGAFDTTFNGRATDAGGDTTFLDGDAYVTKLNPLGLLAYSTFLGGTDGDTGGAIAVDENDNAYVTGYTTCENTNGGVPLPPGGTPPGPCTGTFPVVNAVQPTMDGSFIGFELHNSPTDIFVAKLNPDGNGLIYATYLGGNDFDRGFAIAVRDRDTDDNEITPEAYVTGRIASTNYPVTPGAFQTTKPAPKGNRDAAVSKITG